MTFSLNFSGPSFKPVLLFAPKGYLPNRIGKTPWLLLGPLLILPPLIATASAQTAQRSPALASDSVLYYRIFHHVAVLKQMADAAQQQGKDRSNLRQLVRLRAGLTETEGESLEKIALE